jgi:uncharacterized OB-fold protein
MTREEAITAVKEVAGMSLPWNDRHYEALQMAIKALEEPERKAGRWIVKRDTITGAAYGECTSCGMRQYAGHTKYCPNCGARLENGE